MLGLYAMFAEECSAPLFPEGQLLFMRSEDLFDDSLRESAVREVWRHLGLSAPIGNALAKATGPHMSKADRAPPAGAGCRLRCLRPKRCQW